MRYRQDLILSVSYLWRLKNNMKIDRQLSDVDNIIQLLNSKLNSRDYEINSSEVDISTPEKTAYITTSGRVLNTRVRITNKESHSKLERPIDFYYDRIKLSDIFTSVMGVDYSIEATRPEQYEDQAIIEKSCELLSLVNDAISTAIVENEDDAKIITITPKDGENNYLYTGLTKLRFYLSII